MNKVATKEASSSKLVTHCALVSCNQSTYVVKEKVMEPGKAWRMSDSTVYSLLHATLISLVTGEEPDVPPSFSSSLLSVPFFSAVAAFAADSPSFPGKYALNWEKRNA